jgi:hypothetical protein
MINFTIKNYIGGQKALPHLFLYYTNSKTNYKNID